MMEKNSRRILGLAGLVLSGGIALGATFRLSDAVNLVGTLKTSGSGTPRVAIIEENHSSVLVQLESAVVLERLYQNQGLRTLVLEGYTREHAIRMGQPGARFRRLIPDQSSREAVAVQLLASGEISAFEFMTLTHQDVRLLPAEVQAQYQVDLTDEQAFAPIRLLLSIGFSSATPTEQKLANELIKKQKLEQAAQLLLKERSLLDLYKGFSDPNMSDVSLGRELALIAKLRTAIAARPDAAPPEFMSDLDGLERFLRTADKRSLTMVARTMTGMNQSRTLSALNIGMAHTDLVIKTFKARGVPTALITPRSAMKTSGTDHLSSAAYDRKLQGKSVDRPYQLGWFVSSSRVRGGLRKPIPVINQLWLEQKAFIMGSVDSLAKAGYKCDDGIFKNVLNNLPNTSVDGVEINISKARIVKEGAEAKCSVLVPIILTRGSQPPQTLWVRAAWQSTAAIGQTVSLESQLLAAYAAAQKHIGSDFVPENAAQAKTDFDSGKAKAVAVTARTMALVMPNEELARNAKMTK